MNKIDRYIIFAVRNLKGNAMLAILMVTAIGVIISASMTTLLLLTAMEPAPASQPHQSVQLVALQNDNWGTLKKDWSLETDRICDGKSSGWVRLLL
ncbi:MAG TPA: hypothetical protein VGD63_17380 [Steroidobacteraceae bacterium]